jgi:hypothetical protein
MGQDPFDELVFRHKNGATSTSSVTKKRAPPQKRTSRMNVKVFIHEEVASTQDKMSAQDEVSSHVLMDGTVEAAVSTFHPENIPFSLRILDPDYPDDSQNIIRFDTNYVTLYGPSEFNTLSVPKDVRGKVKVASYHRSVTKNIMPILVQSKVSRSGSHLEHCKVAVQIRSNLNNTGSVNNITLALAIPPTVIAKSLSIAPGPGAGVYDELKRIIRWQVKEIQQGSSIVLGAEVMVASSLLLDDLPNFPIMLRCSSVEDTVSSMVVECQQLDEDHPVTLSVTTHRSFQLLHRLPPPS